MKSVDLNYFIDLVRKRTGIELSDDKGYLIESRLRPLAETWGLKDVASLLETVRLKPDPRLVDSVVDIMTTNETFFFRDETPFKALSEALVRLAAVRGSSPIRIWSAACSTGQEPYSIAMIAQEAMARAPNLKVEIVATDISERCLTKARTGVYSQFEVQRGVAIRRLMQNFDQEGASWRVKSDLRSQITWRNANLMENFRALGRFDIIFCRNVLIYFSRDVRRDILERMALQMAPDGLLFLGAAENTLGITDALVQNPAGPGWQTKRTASKVA
jgi:chemotaxis protein methyltransferase CheR